MSNALSGGGFCMSFSDAFPTSVDSCCMPVLIVAAQDEHITVCISCCSGTLLEAKGAYLFQEQGHDDKGHAIISSDHDGWQKVRIFGPERMGE